MKRTVRAALSALLMACLAVPTATAQITTGTLAGTVQDTSGGVIPGATVTLISESRGTRGVPAVTNATGDFVLPNTTSDTYTVEVTMSGFRTVRRTGVVVSGGERAVVSTIIIAPGGAQEEVTVTAEAPMIQAQSGERSSTITASQIESLPMSGNRNFANLTALTPGTVGNNRLGGGGQNNIMMDGISAMDTGNNGQMLQMNIESIAEVKVLAQGYQAEFGRSSGLQITTVSKSGTNRFHGSVYDIEDNSDWNTQAWASKENGDAKPLSKNRTWGYSLGGPVGRPGGDNKLFFFYSHEYRPTKSAGAITRFRVPTAQERTGDFSQSLDNRGRPIGALRHPVTQAELPGNVIPADMRYAPGFLILNQYPAANHEQQSGENYNLELARPEDKNLTQQPAVRVDYQFSPALRVTGRYSGQRERERVRQGTMPGFNDVLIPYPYISNYGVTVNYTLNSTTFLEATYGSIKNELAGGGAGGIMMNPASNIATLGTLRNDLIYPGAGAVDSRYYQAAALTRTNAPYYDGSSVLLPPTFAFGGLIGGNNTEPPDQTYPGWLNVNKTQDVAVSLTKVAGSHTLKVGFYNNHSFKAQNVGAGGGGSFQGAINFGDGGNNPLDTGFGFANAATGVYRDFRQASKLIEGSMIYNNTEFYLQDNWKVSNRLTFDYGMRFTRQQPQHDQFNQMSNFFPDKWSQSAAPLLYVAGCKSGAVVCSGNDRNAMHPVTREILSAPGANNTASAIGTVVANSGDIANGIRLQGDGISKYSYVWPTVVFGPRFGAAYDLTGNQTVIVRGGLGLFYDRPNGNTIFSIPGNPPTAETQLLTNSRLGSAGGLATVGASDLVTFQYDAKVSSSVQWNAGVQMALPWSSSLDVSYVGQRGFNRLEDVNLNAIDFGAAYRPENQDATKGTSSVPGAVALDGNLLRSLRGLGDIDQETSDFWDQYHSIQTSFNRRFRSGLSFGVNYTLSLSYTGTSGLTKRFDHAADGTISVRADQAEYEELMKDLDLRRHILRGNIVWDLPNVSSGGGARRIASALLNDWQLSSVLTAGSGQSYDPNFDYRDDGDNVNLTGSPSYGARIRYEGDPGSGCSSNQYAQFNTSVVRGPTYNSVGLESGRNRLNFCPDRIVDLSLSRSITLGGGRAMNLRVDAFNAFNVVIFDRVENTVEYVSPNDQSLRNSQTLADGSNDPTKLKPNSAGFGAADRAKGMRTIRATVRFSF